MNWEKKDDEKKMKARRVLLNQEVFEKSPLKEMSEADFIALQKKNEEISNARDAAEKSLNNGSNGGKKKTKKHKKTLKKKKHKKTLKKRK